jgi:hypothetical protein
VEKLAAAGTSKPKSKSIHERDWPTFVLLKGEGGVDGKLGFKRDIRINDVTVGVAGRILLEDTSVKLSQGFKYGLIGKYVCVARVLGLWKTQDTLRACFVLPCCVCGCGCVFFFFFSPSLMLSPTSLLSLSLSLSLCLFVCVLCWLFLFLYLDLY